MRQSSFMIRVISVTALGLLQIPALPTHGQDRQKPAVVKPASQPAPAAASPAGKVPASKADAEPSDASPFHPSAPSASQAADEAAIRAAGEAFVKAYDAADAEAVAALFSADAEYVDEQGVLFEGRAAIEESLAEFFAENPGCQLEMTIDTLRFVSPSIAIEDGKTIVTRKDDPAQISTRYTTVHAKTQGKWLAVSVRDRAPNDPQQHSTELAQLDWLLGDWVDEGDDAVVAFSCEAVDGGNFLLRKFAVHVAGQEALSGTQRIGWDPLTGKLRMWIFDSEGGYGEGCWHRRGDDWALKLSGVSSTGEPASSTSIYTRVNGHTMTWQTVDHEVAGVQIPDSDVITMVRSAPAPELTEAP